MVSAYSVAAKITYWCGENFAPLVSALGTIASAWVAYRLYRIQQSIESSKKSDLHLWYDPGTQAGILTLVNLGKEPLLIKKLDIPSKDRFHLLMDGQQVLNFIAKPESVYQLRVYPVAGDIASGFELRFQFFDGHFKSATIDSKFRGPYRLNDLPLRKAKSSELLPNAKEAVT